MGPQRMSIGYVQLGVLTVVAALAAVLGVSMSSGATPPELLAAAHATMASSSTAQVAIRTYGTGGPSGALADNATSMGLHATSPAYSSTVTLYLSEPASRYLRAVLDATGVQRSSTGYTFAAPASTFEQPGLPGYAWANARAQVAVTVAGGSVRSMVVDVLAMPAVQVQHVTFTG